MCQALNDIWFQSTLESNRGEVFLLPLRLNMADQMITRIIIWKLAYRLDYIYFINEMKHSNRAKFKPILLNNLYNLFNINENIKAYTQIYRYS